MRKSDASWYLLLLITFVVWGTQHPPIKILSGEVGLILFNFLRYSIAALVLLPFVLKSKVKIERKDLVGISFLGLIGTFLFGVLNILGVRLSTASNNALLLNSWPLLVVFLAPVLVNEKTDKKAIIGSLIGFVGVVLVAANGTGFADVVNSGFFRGNVLIILSGLCIATYSMLNTKYIEKYGGLSVTFYAITSGSILFFMYSVLSGGLFAITQVSFNSILLILWVAIPTTAITYVIWFRSIDRIGVVKTSSFFLLIPVSGVLTSALFLGEKLTQYTVIGTILILAGVWLVQKK